MGGEWAERISYKNMDMERGLNAQIKGEMCINFAQLYRNLGKFQSRNIFGWARSSENILLKYFTRIYYFSIQHIIISENKSIRKCIIQNLS